MSKPPSYVEQSPSVDTFGSPPAYTEALLRHFIDLRDGTHGGAVSRRDKEQFYIAAVALLDPHATRVLEEINRHLLRDTGEVAATGVRGSSDGGAEAVWALTWPEQQAAGVKPIVLRASFGSGVAQHPLPSGTVG